MTDRLKGVEVIFDKDYREDDAERLLDAIRMLRGVALVRPIVSDPLDSMEVSRAKWELRAKLFDLLKDAP